MPNFILSIDEAAFPNGVPKHINLVDDAKILADFTVTSPHLYLQKVEEDSEQEYWESVGAIADDVESRIKDDPSEDLHDLIHENMDGSSWVTYYSSAVKTMTYTRNDDALENELGECPSGSWADVTTKFAYYALAADVRDELEKRHGGIDPSEWFPTCGECGESVDAEDDLNIYDECPACEAKREQEEAEEAAADAETPDHSDNDNDTEKE